jgi:hypothetical protein
LGVALGATLAATLAAVDGATDGAAELGEVVVPAPPTQALRVRLARRRPMTGRVRRMVEDLVNGANARGV